MAVLESAIFWIVIAAASEIIALSPLKDNSIIQLVLHAIKSVKPAKKDLNIPDDGQWIFTYDSRSTGERIKRWADEQKFYATLPLKLDIAEEEYLKAIDESLLAEWEYWEELEGDTPLGGEMRVNIKSVENLNKDDNDN